MFAHSKSDTKKFSLRSPAELNSTCLMFIFNVNVSEDIRLDIELSTDQDIVEAGWRQLHSAEDQPGGWPGVGVTRPGLRAWG